MKKIISTLLLSFCCFVAFAQNSIKGVVVDGNDEKPIKGVAVIIKDTSTRVLTNDNGEFVIENLSNGDYILQISFQGYESQNFPVQLSGSPVDLGTIYFYKDLEELTDISIVNITDDELNADDGFTDNIAGLLQSSRDVFLAAAAFDFSATFFRPRGLDNANGKVLINGVEMNKLFNGRPQWANWGGLNDLQRNQAFTRGVSPNENTFGDIAGVNSITMRASDYAAGTRISYAAANRSYQGRVMASHSSGPLKNGWSYAFLVSRRYGDEGYIDGTLYDSNSFFASVEKRLNDSHSLNFNFIYAQNRRGRATALTDEIYRLKGRQYNPFWGYLNGEKVNTRERRIEEPIIMLNHYWNISEKTTLNTNVSYQTGFTGNTRIDNGGTRLVTFNGIDTYEGGARNPSPDYYQNLPSFFLNGNNPSTFDYQQAFLAQQQFVNDGQFNWEEIIFANQNQALLGGNSIYVLQEDRTEDDQLSINSILFTEINENIKLNASASYRRLRNQTYAEVKDLLGGTGFLDVDFFAETQLGQSASNLAQSDLRNPNRIAREGERYKYNYEMDASVAESFVQAQFNYTKVDFYLAANASTTSYQRNGLYENGYFQGDLSFGKSEKLNFTNFGVKGGLTYKVTGQHLLDFNTAYLTKAPNIRNSFENARQNNITVRDLESEKIFTVDGSYILRTPKITGRLTGYFTEFTDGTDINFFFTESGNTFTQEVLTNIGRRNFGGELGIEYQVTPTLKLKGAAAMGQFTFTNNPNLYYSSDDFLANPTQGEEVRRSFGDGTTKLRNLHVAGGPERAFQLGFEYRDPDYWWFGATVNHFSRAFVDPSALKRSDAFAIDFDLLPTDILFNGNLVNRVEFGGNISGFTYNDFDEAVARDLLQQEQFPSYFLVNLTGGKSWRVGDYFIGFFATINNLLNQEYRTGGFEQSRRIGYRDQLQEQTNPNGPVFGNRYFFGLGTTYFVNVYFRF
jgi:hypothetical protein